MSVHTCLGTYPEGVTVVISGIVDGIVIIIFFILILVMGMVLFFIFALSVLWGLSTPCLWRGEPPSERSILPCSTDIGLGHQRAQTTGCGQMWCIWCWSGSHKNHHKFRQFHFAGFENSTSQWGWFCSLCLGVEAQRGAWLIHGQHKTWQRNKPWLL